MIFCNGCPRSGTHILTDICSRLNFTQSGGSMIKRYRHSQFILKSKKTENEIFKIPNDQFVHSHIAFNDQSQYIFGRHKMIFIIRNPRNIALSWIRHICKLRSIEVTPENITEIMQKGMFYRSIPEYISFFTPWIHSPFAFVVKFEDIFLNSSTLISMTEYLESKFNPADFTDLFENSSTYSGKNSNWQEIWSSNIQKVWDSSGGSQLEYMLKDFYQNYD